MAHGGRPVERPAHLLPEQREHAQRRTRQWRDQTGYSQQEMAKAIGVGYSTYRAWENSADEHAGPTRPQTAQVNKALRRLLGDGYADGGAFDVWGWPREQDMSYQEMVELLHSAGFEVPRLPVVAGPPPTVLWVHRVRTPNLLHGVFALAAAAATRAGLPVRLLLDDADLLDRDRSQCDELEFRIREWIAFGSGDDAKLSTGLFSTLLTDEHLADRYWDAVNDYLNPPTTVLDILLASKVISPMEYSIHPEESVLALLRNQSLPADRILTPLRNCLVFEAEIARLLRQAPIGGCDQIITLGGADERVLWDVWHQGCSDDLATRVRHIYLRSVPMPSYLSPWKEPALWATTNRSVLTDYLSYRTADAGNTDLMEWLLRSAIHLPALLSPAFRDGLSPALTDVEALLQTPDRLAEVVGAAAKAVVDWLSA